MDSIKSRISHLRILISENFSVHFEFSSRELNIHNLVCLAEIALVVLFVPLVFETNDDVIMNSLVSGMTTSEPNEFMMFTNILIGELLAALYRYAPSQNWYTWYIVGSLALGYWAVQYSFVKIRGSVGSKAMRHLLILSLFIQVFFILQFTRVASVAIAGGMILILMSNRNRHLEIIAGVLLVVLGSAIRYPVFLMYAIVGLPAFVLMVIKWERRKLAALCLAFLFGILLHDYHQHVYNTNPKMLEYKAFNSIRSDVTTFDSPQFTYESRKELLEEFGWTRNDFMLVSNFNLDVGYQKFNIDNLKALADFGEQELVDLSTGRVAYSTLKAVLKKFLGFHAKWQFLPVILAISFIIVAKRRSELLILLVYAIYIFLVAFSLGLFGNGQLKPWVIYGMTLPLFLVAIFFFVRLETAQLIPKSGIDEKIKEKALLVLFTFCLALPLGKFSLTIPKAVLERIHRDSVVHKKIASFDDPFYVDWTSTNHYDLFDLPYNKSNAYALGWRAGSPWNEHLIESYTGKKDIGIYNITDRPVTWYFRTAEDLSFQDYRKIVVQFYRENYPDFETNYSKYIVTKKDTLHRYTFYSGL